MKANQKIIYKSYRHNPPHLFIPNAKYFITEKSHHFKHRFRENEDAIEEIVRNSPFDKIKVEDDFYNQDWFGWLDGLRTSS